MLLTPGRTPVLQKRTSRRCATSLLGQMSAVAAIWTKGRNSKEPSAQLYDNSTQQGRLATSTRARNEQWTSDALNNTMSEQVF